MAAALAAGLPAGARADAGARAAAASALVALFADTCLAHAGDVAGVRAALADRHLAPMPPAGARRILVRPGEVYPVALPAQHMAVLSFDDGICGTVAEDVDPGTLLGSLATAMKTRGIRVAAVGPARAGARAQAYRLVGARVRLELMVDIDPIGDRMQASMLGAPLPVGGR